MSQPLYSVDNLEQFIGQTLGVSDWVLIDQERINQFAACTGDHQWIHVDEARAQASPIGTTIAHGFLVLSLLPMLTANLGLMPQGALYALNYGTDKVRFTSFVPVGSRVRNHVELLEVTRKPNGSILVKTKNTMEIEGQEKPAMVAETLKMIFPA
jgi:acyl dehydratase